MLLPVKVVPKRGVISKINMLFSTVNTVNIQKRNDMRLSGIPLISSIVIPAVSITANIRISRNKNVTVVQMSSMISLTAPSIRWKNESPSTYKLPVLLMRGVHLLFSYQ
ncbi:hypothetical protein D3C77_537430 [compost metagenome]